MNDLNSALARLLAPSSTDQQVSLPAQRLAPKPPKGWEPTVAYRPEAGIGEAVSRGYEQEQEHAKLITDFGFDPETHHLSDLEYRQWDAAIGNGETKTMHYYKCKIRAGKQVPSEDLNALIEDIRNWQPQFKDRPYGDDAFCVFLSDFQIGKGEGGGSAVTVERIKSVFDQVLERIGELRAVGRPLGTLYVFGLGDLVEGCSGYYNMQEYQTDLNRRQQSAVVRRLIYAALTMWSQHFNTVVVASVAGNHGENRKNGKAFTDFGDNDDIAVFETVADMLAVNPEAFGHIKFVFPKDDRLSLCLDVAGTGVAITHGHQFTGGGKLAQAKALEWWKGQTFGLQPVSDATILVSAHFHHYSCIVHGARTHFQTPALDGGSQWFTESSGSESPPGLLTFRVSAAGWSDVQVLTP